MATSVCAEVIAIGDELISGQRLDTNSQWLSQRLAEVGVPVRWHTTVGDNLDDHTRAIQIAAGRADLVVMTGGLGPTADDLTREAMARAGGVELQLDERQLAHIESLFQRRGRQMAERNRLQAMFPAGSEPIHNPHGSAPGIAMRFPRTADATCHMFALPGVPVEMHEMWEQTVRPAVAELTGQTPQVITHRRLKCFGMGESDVEARLPDLIRRGRDPLVGITASQATITLRITARGESTEDCLRRIAPTEQMIREHLGELVFGVEDEELQHAVTARMRENGHTLAVIEAATNGLVSTWLSELDPVGEVLRGSLVAKSLRSEWLNDRADEWESLCGKQEVHRAAEWLKSRFNVDYALVVGRVPDNEAIGDRAVGIPMAVADTRGTFAAMHAVAGHPEIIIPRAAKQALDLVRRRLSRAAPESTD